MKLKLLTIFLTIGFLQASAQYSTKGSLVNYIQAPAGSLVPDVFLDNAGILHMVYIQDQNAWYIRSTNNGATFSAPVKVNSSGTVEFNMGERGPKLAVGIDGVIHVVWMDHWSAGVNVHARYTRSTDGGNSFEPLKAVSSSPGVDGVTVAADGNNHVAVFWHIMVPQQTQIPEATWLHFARSSDNGLSFSPDTNVVITNHSGLACSMCMSRARFGQDDHVYLAFRSAENNIRDFYVLKGGVSGNNFTAVRVNNDNWNIGFCPMVGPELEMSGSGNQYCAFMSNYHVYWAVSDPGVTSFTQHVATPLNENNEIFPTVVANNSGKVLFLWQVGPMSVTDSATVKWALYNTNGTFTGQQGTVARTFSGTKATAFAGTDDNFYVVVDADKLTTGVTNLAASKLCIFPNPAHDVVNISGITGKTTLLVIDVFGRIVLGKEVSANTTFDVSKLPPGSYFIEAGDTSRKVTGKVLK